MIVVWLLAGLLALVWLRLVLWLVRDAQYGIVPARMAWQWALITLGWVAGAVVVARAVLVR